jgi:two-component system phosphate regulon response regulator PhoB
MARILIIEDERDIQEVLGYNLRQAGHEPTIAGGGKDGLAQAKSLRPDLVLLDLMLPDLPGTEVCKELKRHPDTAAIPIIMLTARGEEIDRIVGFEVGAEDYVVKPFSIRELMLRVQAVLGRGRRTSGSGRAVSGSERGSVAFGRLKIDRDAHRVFVDGAEVELTALEFKLLDTLLERKNRVQSRETLLTDVWGMRPDISTRTVDTHVKRLREKLGDAGEYIDTVRGVGYRFKDEPAG